ncbi:hypothetical protein P3G55_11060 [Leptospira sp. 96542]|nr:hypothetical protein [Leptospira sp. 96542]
MFKAIFTLFFSCITLSAQDIQLIDGNGNIYNLNLNHPNTIEYIPIQTKQSSSGVYSGGNYSKFEIQKKQIENLTSLFSEINHSQYKKTENYNKGTRHLVWLNNNEKKEYYFPLNDKVGDKIESKFKEFLSMQNNSETNLHFFQNPLIIPSENNPWSALAKNPKLDPQGNKIPLTNPNENNIMPVNLPTELLYKGNHLLFYALDSSEIRVNENYFSELYRTDVTKLTLDTPVLIGVVLTPLRTDSDFLMNFLIQSQVLISYWHTDAEIKLLDRLISKNEVCYSFLGEHHYYTNKKNTTAYQFKTCINNESGKITTIGI